MHTSREASTLSLAQVALTSVQERPPLPPHTVGGRDGLRALSIAQFTLTLEKGGEGLTVCMYRSATHTVWPLQVKSMPSCLKGACLHANMDYKDRRRVMEEAMAGKVAILLVSPEAVVLDGGLNSLLSLPSVAFACIDEVHCLSQWSHNFRPSYLRLCKVRGHVTLVSQQICRINHHHFIVCVLV